MNRLAYESVVEGSGSPTGLSPTVTYEDVGSTTVEEPSWLEEAEAEATN